MHNGVPSSDELHQRPENTGLSYLGKVHADVSIQVNGAPNGNGPGGCNLKSGTAQSLNSDGLVSTRIGAIMARYGPSM